MNLATLLHKLPVRLARGDASIDVTAVTENSREAQPGCLFVARPGSKFDGRAYIPQAVAAGAVAVLTDDAARVPENCAAVVADDIPHATALLAERFHGHPSRSLRLIGITGTNGKTTTSYLVHHLLNAVAADDSASGGAAGNPAGRCGLLGTVAVDEGGGPIPADLTTPPAGTISRHLARMLDGGCRSCVMEVSSHALQQQRVGGLAFDVGIFTNLSGDHLDYHGSMERYLAAKRRLFEMLPADGLAIVNADDPMAGRIVEGCRARVITCSLSDVDADWTGRIEQSSIVQTDVLFQGPCGTMRVRLPLCGRYNVMNALQAAAAAHAAGLDAAMISRALATCPAPPGRLEPITNPDDPFTIYVDYAHTDDALDNVLQALRPLVPAAGRLRVVFGCGGDRDPSKRPRMARVACEHADEVIVTSDNPREEDSQKIVDEILAGVPEAMRDQTLAIVDRREAIHAAIERSGPGDVVLIAGKGHEDYQIIGTQKRPFDDRLVAREAMGRQSGMGAAV